MLWEIFGEPLYISYKVMYLQMDYHSSCFDAFYFILLHKLLWLNLLVPSLQFWGRSFGFGFFLKFLVETSSKTPLLQFHSQDANKFWEDSFHSSYTTAILLWLQRSEGVTEEGSLLSL